MYIFEVDYNKTVSKIYEIIKPILTMKTQAILSSLLVCIVTTLPAQINLNDSTVQVVAYWSKGDSYDYLYDY